MDQSFKSELNLLYKYFTNLLRNKTDWNSNNLYSITFHINPKTYRRLPSISTLDFWRRKLASQSEKFMLVKEYGKSVLPHFHVLGVFKETPKFNNKHIVRSPTCFLMECLNVRPERISAAKRDNDFLQRFVIAIENEVNKGVLFEDIPMEDIWSCRESSYNAQAIIKWCRAKPVFKQVMRIIAYILKDQVTDLVTSFDDTWMFFPRRTELIDLIIKLNRKIPRIYIPELKLIQINHAPKKNCPQEQSV